MMCADLVWHLVCVKAGRENPPGIQDDSVRVSESKPLI